MSDTPASIPGEDLLADPSDLAVRLDEFDADDPRLVDAIKRLSARFRGATNNHVTAVTDVVIELSGNGNSALQLPCAPLADVPIVTIGGTAVTDFETGKRAGVLRRDCGWPDGLDNIQVTFSGGYDTVPADIADAVLDMAEAFCNMVAGVESVTTGDESVKMANSLINGGSLGTWSEVVAKYTLGGRGDRS